FSILDLRQGAFLSGDRQRGHIKSYGHVLRQSALKAAVVRSYYLQSALELFRRLGFDGATSHLQRQAMSDPGQSEKQRNREIARNESERETTSAVRVSSWAIGIAIIVGLIAFGVIGALHR
ncbi:MAG: hypothetical protein JSS22_18145, partial [Proteobacteria bacterium]|nr:hypothetical protein [Pseudomonadota bacterium]